MTAAKGVRSAATPGRRGRPETGGEASGGTHSTPRREDSTLVQAVAQRGWNVERLARWDRGSKVPFAFTTAGSSGRRPAELIEVARMPLFGARLVIDCRETPFSQHTPEWNRDALRDAVLGSGMEYVHRPDLGVPRTVRKTASGTPAELAEIFRWYDREVATEATVRTLAPILEKRPILLCTELSPRHCHRSRLALAIESLLEVNSYDI